MKCPHCQNERADLMEYMPSWRVWVCTVCSKMFNDFEVKDDINRTSQEGSRNIEGQIPKPDHK